jgi:hypothetical protein
VLVAEKLRQLVPLDDGVAGHVGGAWVVSWNLHRCFLSGVVVPVALPDPSNRRSDRTALCDDLTVPPAVKVRRSGRGATAVHHRLPPASRGRRTIGTYRTFGVEVELLE